MAGEWWQDEVFWRSVEPYLHESATVDAVEDTVEELFEWMELEKPSRVLDVGCGTGRLLIPIAHKGHQVLGVDICERFRRTARQRISREKVDADVIAGNAFEGFSLGDSSSFDAALVAYGVIGYSEDPVQDIHAVKHIKAALGAGGKLLIQTYHPNASYGRFKHRSNKGMCVEERTFDRPSSTMIRRWTVYTRNKGQRVWVTTERLYTLDDLKGLLKFCEFTQIEGTENLTDSTVTVVGVAA